jgi:hypothetical protein
MSEKKPRFGGGCEMSFTSRVTFGLREFLLGLDAAFGNRKHRIPSLLDTPYRKISKPADQNCMPDRFITPQAATDTIDYVATDTWGNTATDTRTVIMQAATSFLSVQ